MDFPMCILKKPTPWIAVIVVAFICVGFSGYNYSSVVATCLVLILSSLFFTLSNKNSVLVRKPIQHEVHSSDKKFPPQVEEIECEKSPSRVRCVADSGNIVEIEKAEEKRVVESPGYLVRTEDQHSESDSIDHSTLSDDSDADHWQCSGNVCRTLDGSDDSISDEESLIEIALPSGHYVGPKEENHPRFTLLQKLPYFSSETFFQQDSLMELLAEINEMNEEENLIEIDISMGSIKCSRFEIEA